MTLEEAQTIMMEAIKQIQADGTVRVATRINLATVAPQEVNINPEEVTQEEPPA